MQFESIREQFEILALFGTNGLTDEHSEALSQLKDLEEIIFFLNGDEPGRKATAKHAETLRVLKPALKITQVQVPEGKDVNSLAQTHPGEPGQADPGIFIHLLEKRTLFFSTEVGCVEASSEGKKDPVLPVNAPDFTNPFKIRYKTETAVYYIKGGIKKELDSMKISLDVEPGTPAGNYIGKYRTKLDLYEDKQVEKAAREAAEKLALRADLIERDLSKLTDELDKYRERETEPEQSGQTRVRVPTPIKEKCIRFLSQSNLLSRINELIGKAGVVGEEKNRLFLFGIATSYKMADTLHALVQGSSGSGKTHLIVKVSEFIPPEDCKCLTRVTESSFYNYGEYELFCMEDLDGLKEEAFLAFRELQSRGQLTSSTSAKDENGNIRAMIRTVRGPIASLSATTKGEEYKTYSFNRKEIRDALRLSKTQQHRFFNDLLELEYISRYLTEQPNHKESTWQKIIAYIGKERKAQCPNPEHTLAGH